MKYICITYSDEKKILVAHISKKCHNFLFTFLNFYATFKKRFLAVRKFLNELLKAEAIASSLVLTG